MQAVAQKFSAEYRHITRRERSLLVNLQTGAETSRAERQSRGVRMQGAIEKIGRLFEGKCDVKADEARENVRVSREINKYEWKIK